VTHPPTFTREEWFKLPMAFRHRWWEETANGRAPSCELLAAARDEIAKQDGVAVADNK